MSADATTTASTKLLAAFAFAPFSRIQARRAGLEADLRHAEAAGLAKFIRCAGAPTYDANLEMFRMLV